MFCMERSSKCCLPSGFIKHGVLEKWIVGHFPSLKPPFTSGIFQPCLMKPEAISINIPVLSHDHSYKTIVNPWFSTVKQTHFLNRKKCRAKEHAHLGHALPHIAGSHSLHLGTAYRIPSGDVFIYPPVKNHTGVGKTKGKPYENQRKT